MIKKVQITILNFYTFRIHKKIAILMYTLLLLVILNPSASVKAQGTCRTDSTHTYAGNNLTYLNNRSYFTYDVYGNKSSQENQIFKFSNSTWENKERYTFSYDNNNRMTEKLKYLWNGLWSYDVQTVYSYNENGDIETTASRWWNTSSLTWMNSVMLTNNYDNNGNSISELIQSWNYGSATWENDYLTSYSYDANNKLIQALTQQWSDSENDWVNSDRYIYTNDFNGNQIRNDWNRWGGTSWSGHARWDYTYNAANLLTGCVNSGWENETWVDYYRETYTYDSNGNLISELTEAPYDETTWQNVSLLNYYISCPVTSIVNSSVGSSLAVFPNPATDILYIPENNKIEILDMQGTLQETYVDGQQQLTISAYQAGMYILKLSDKSGVRMTKFIKQ